MAWGSVDLRFQNDTEYGVLVNAEVTPATVVGAGRGHRADVQHEDLGHRHDDVRPLRLRRPGTRTLDTPDCYPNTGYSGFQVDVTRIFRKVGEDAVDHREVFHTDYIARDTVICRAARIARLTLAGPALYCV